MCISLIEIDTRLARQDAPLLSTGCAFYRGWRVRRLPQLKQGAMSYKSAYLSVFRSDRNDVNANTSRN